MWTLKKLDKLPDAKYNTITKGDVVKGEIIGKPTVGKVFIFPNSEGNKARVTSPVTEIVSETHNTIVFKTYNSIYELKLNDN